MELIAAGAGPRGLYLQFGALLHHLQIKLTLSLPVVPWGKRARGKKRVVGELENWKVQGGGDL